MKSEDISAKIEEAIGANNITFSLENTVDLPNGKSIQIELINADISSHRLLIKNRVYQLPFGKESRLVYLKVGVIAIVDVLYEGIVKDAIKVNRFPNKLSQSAVLMYTAVTMAAMLDVDLEGKVVMDAGCGQAGILGLVAKKRGAESVIAVDRVDYFEQYVRQNYALNNYKGLDWRCKIIDNSIATPKKYDDKDIIVVANIGPAYGNTHIQIIDNLALNDNVKIFINGGFYHDPSSEMGPLSHITALREAGFSRMSQYSVKGHDGGIWIAITAER